jgi:hypothetical protein
VTDRDWCEECDRKVRSALAGNKCATCIMEADDELEADDEFEPEIEEVRVDE